MTPVGTELRHSCRRAWLRGPPALVARDALLAAATIAILPTALWARADRTASPAGARARSSGAEEASEPDVVVTGVRDIVVNGRARRCQARADDPLDRVNVRSGVRARGLMAILPAGQGGYEFVRNMEQITGPDFWQRTGVGMDQYVFRGPSNGKPMCIGGDVDVGDFAGFRRIVDATPYRGRRIRFTAWVATGQAHLVRFWLTAGTKWVTSRRRNDRKPVNRLLNGGNTNHVPWGGNHGWTPVLLETGPIDMDADHVSYGFGLQGSGDVWVYKPALEIVTGDLSAASEADRIVIGVARR